jgi:hypothetical protein
VAAVKKINDTLWHYINYNAKPINSNKYKYCGSFKNGKAFVIDVDDRKYFINKNGDILFEIPINAEIVLDYRTNEKYKLHKISR